MFCPRCGRSGEELFEGLCRSCFIKNTILLEVPDDIDVKICTRCGSYLNGTKWIKPESSDEKTLQKIMKKQIKADKTVEDLQTFIEIVSVRGTIIQCSIQAKGNVLGKMIEQEYSTEFKIEKNVCPECSKFVSGYYEAVIQIRADNRIPSNEEIKKVDEIIINNIEKLSEKNKMAYISERTEIKEGVDYYVGSYKVAKRLTTAIKDTFGGIIKESPKLMGRDKTTGKDLYRIWISLRMPYFREGDFIKYGDSIGQVISLDGRKIISKELNSINKLSILWREYNKINTVAKKEDIKKTTVTAKTPKTIQILHPDSYQPVDIEIHEKIADIGIGEEISVVEIEGELYILN
ncbi:MAG: NMD protein affecting ribosome stability and mRNA decay [Euryarchaeota archaeon]|nr:NMD protein affecting ribosome stability and mRNA decay [Euryarchaeota archaeon]